MRLQESGEMYLETIYILSQKKSDVHSIDVAAEMNYSKPSVSRAVNLLKDNDYLNIDNSGRITLTDAGLEVAERIYERHQLISDILITLGVDQKTATADACRIEHVISKDSFAKVKEWYAKHKNKTTGNVFHYMIRYIITSVTIGEDRKSVV